MSKVCPKCLQGDKAFNANKTHADGLQSYYTDCDKAYQAEWYKKNRDKVKDRVYTRRQITGRNHVERIIDYLKEHPCVDCGERDPIVLQFDHVRGKKDKAISRMVYNHVSWDRIAREIEKCEIRCANCHIRRTAIDQDWKTLKIIEEKSL